MSGRSGRRGYDNRGHVVLFGVSKAKQQQVMASSFPSLSGNIVLTPVTVLRLLLSYCQSEEGESAKTDIVQRLKRIVELNFISFSNNRSLVPFAQRMVLFYLDLFRSEDIIEYSDLTPCNIAGLVNNLHYLEPGCILLAVLLQSKQLYGLVQPHSAAIESAAKKGDLDEIPRDISEILVKLLATVIGRLSIRHDKKHITPSKDLPETITNSMKKYNARVKALLLRHLNAFVTEKQMTQGVTRLPLSGTDIHLSVPDTEHSTTRTEDLASLLHQQCIQYVIQNPFRALRGRGDDFSTKDLVNLRSQELLIRQFGIPVFDHLKGRINSYALDFWSHGQSKKLVEENGIEDNKVWTYLYDLTLGVRTVSTALRKAIEEELNRFGYQLDERLLVMINEIVQSDNSLSPAQRSKLNILRVLTGISDRFRDHMKKQYGTNF